MLASVLGFLAANCLQDALPPPRSLCSIGSPLYSCDVMQRELEPFLKAYATRPFKRNPGGMSMFTAFMLWCSIKVLDPLHIIESGAHNGLGTWLLRAAAPLAQIIVITPVRKPSMWIDKQPDTLYFAGPAYRDFRRVRWECYGIDKERTLIFFDDHQSEYRRMLEMHVLGFRHAVFDDNHPPHTGDNYNLKKACDGQDFATYRLLLGANPPDPIIFLNGIGWDGKNRRWDLSHAAAANLSHTMRQVAETYFELPYLWPATSRFPNISNDKFEQMSQYPFLTAEEGRAAFHRLRILEGATAERASFDENLTSTLATEVTHMAYLRVRRQHPQIRVDKAAAWPFRSRRYSPFVTSYIWDQRKNCSDVLAQYNSHLSRRRRRRRARNRNSE